jgi:hypothetical protein
MSLLSLRVFRGAVGYSNKKDLSLFLVASHESTSCDRGETFRVSCASFNQRGFPSLILIWLEYLSSPRHASSNASLLRCLDMNADEH